jgi:Ca2+-transporting ATPase
MGHHGTEVARQAADLVLADDELATVVAAIEEGRRVYANIRRFLVFGLAGGAAEILLMLFGPLVGLTLPLLAAQILWINLLTHGITGVALSGEPADPRAMHRPPRPREQHVLGDGLWQLVLVLGVELTIACLIFGVWADHTGRAWQTMLFLTLTSLQLGVALGLRRRLLVRDNPALPALVGLGVVLALAGVYVPALRDVLSTEALPIGDAALAMSVGVLGLFLARIRGGRRIPPLRPRPRRP